MQPEDWALCRMVSSILKTPCEPKAGDDHYFFEADYGKNPPEIILAIYDAICGRAGERLVSINDNPDAHHLLVKMRFAEGVTDRAFVNEPDDYAAEIYHSGDETCLALQFTGDNAEQVAEFVGGGVRQLVCGRTLFSFVNAQSVIQTVRVGQYVRKVRDYLYEVVPADKFEKVWQR